MSDWRAVEWEKWGRTDPYFAVLTEPRFRADRLDDAGRDAFFRGGELEVARTLAEMRAVAGRDIDPGRAVDFGCGVGRLTIPLAAAFREVVAIDISEAMLDEARSNCARAGVTNVVFSRSTPGLDSLEGPFDFVHSYIVLQHIPPALGHVFIDALVDRLGPRGCGMLHVTFARRTGALRRWVQRARRSSLLLHRLMNLAQGQPAGTPHLAMFEYDLARILAGLEARGFDRVGGRLTNHGGALGIMLAFARSERPTA